MKDYAAVFASLGIKLPEILVPAGEVDPSRWAVVACDQYSSEREYWDAVGQIVGDDPSTLRLTFPECYLEDADKKDRIVSIQKHMREYLAAGFLKRLPPGFILVERKTPFMDSPRLGLVMAVDLEMYQYGKDSRSLIRPTEGTIVERLPPRMEIRRGAAMELPHIMLLVDDQHDSMIGAIHAVREGLPLVYDFDLMMGAGHVRGWLVNDEKSLEKIFAALDRLADIPAFESRYGTSDLLLFAVGDGNHSLATAKAIWEETKASLGPDTEAIATHPARYALVELVNIYDAGLPFHPIHRVLFNVDRESFLAAAASAGAVISRLPDSRFEDAVASVDASASDPGDHLFAFTSAEGSGLLRFPKATASLAAGTIQEIIDEFRKAHPEAGIDYIHGTESLVSLATRPGNLGLYLPPVDKASFFGTVIRDGVMPRKTFSMGEAPEKRFYVEARLIQPDL